MPTYGLINLLYYALLPGVQYQRLELIWKADQGTLTVTTAGRMRLLQLMNHNYDAA